MTLPTFTPPVSPSSLTDKPEINIRRADFGDGYTQTTRNGLNHMRRVASIRWEVLTREQADEISTFLEARGGVEPFYSRVPGEDQPTKWTCEEWSRAALPAALASIDLTFRQSFDLRR